MIYNRIFIFVQRITVRCAPGETTDLPDGRPGTVTYETCSLDLNSVLQHMAQTGEGFANILGDVQIQNGVINQQVCGIIA